MAGDEGLAAQAAARVARGLHRNGGGRRGRAVLGPRAALRHAALRRLLRDPRRRRSADRVAAAGERDRLAVLRLRALQRGDHRRRPGLRAAGGEQGWAAGELGERIATTSWLRGGLGLTLTFLLFPDGRLPGRGWRWVPWAATVGALISVPVWSLSVASDSASSAAATRSRWTARRSTLCSRSA